MEAAIGFVDAVARLERTKQTSQASTDLASWSHHQDALLAVPSMQQVHGTAWAAADQALQRSAQAIQSSNTDPESVATLLSTLLSSPDTALQSWLAAQTQTLQHTVSNLPPAEEWSRLINPQPTQTATACDDTVVQQLAVRHGPPSVFGEDGAVERLVLDSSGSVEDLLAGSDHDTGPGSGGAGHATYATDRGADNGGDSSVWGGPEPGWTVLGSPGMGSSTIQTALTTLQDSSASLQQLQSALSRLMGVDSDLLAEDVLASSQWPQLCASLTALLQPHIQPQLEPQAAVTLCHTCIELVVYLAAEACTTSPPHVAALLQVVTPAVVALVPECCGASLLAEVQGSGSDCPSSSCSHIALAAVTVQLLRSVTHDWHFLSARQQQDCSTAVAAMMAVLCSPTPPRHSSDTPVHQLTPLHAALALDPDATWLQRLAHSANSSHTLVAAARQPLPPRSGRALAHSLQQAMVLPVNTADPVGLLQAHGRVLSACSLLSVPTHVWQQHAPGAAVANVDMEHLLAATVTCVSAMVDRGCADQLATVWLGMLQHVAEQQPQWWADSVLQSLVRSLAQESRYLAQHLALLSGVVTALAQSAAGAQIVLSVCSPVVDTLAAACTLHLTSQHSGAHQTTPGPGSDLLHALAAAAGRVSGTPATQQCVAAITAHMIDVLQQSDAPGPEAATPQRQAAVDVLLHACCVQPQAVAALEQGSRSVVEAIAHHLVQAALQCIHLRTSQSCSPQSVSVDYLVAVAGVLALSPVVQAALLKAGWLRSWLLAEVPNRDQHSGPELAVSLSRLHERVPAVVSLSVVRCALSWCGVMKALVATGGSTPAAPLQGPEPLEVLVQSLDLSPGQPSSSTATTAAMDTDADTALSGTASSSNSAAAAARLAQANPPTVGMLPPPTAALASLQCLTPLSHLPTALIQLKTATNITWYLNCITQTDTTTTTEAQHHPTVAAADPLIALAGQLAARLDAATAVVQGSGGNSAQSLWPARSASCPQGAISAVVQADAGMSDPVRWLHQAATALQTDLRHHTGLDVRALALLLQRCVLVAWPGVQSLGPQVVATHAWLDVGHAAALPWGSVSVRQRQGAGLDAQGGASQPSQSAQLMVHCTLTALLHPPEQHGTAPVHERPSTPLPDPCPCLPPVDSQYLSAWVDAACTALGCREGAEGYASLTGDEGGDALMVCAGALLGAGSIGPSRVAAGLSALEFLQGLLRAPSAGWVWPQLFRRATGGVTGAATALCGALQTVLQVSEPQLWAALGGHRGVAMSTLLHYVVRWLGFADSCAAGPTTGLAWCGVLRGDQVLAALALTTLLGPDYLVYQCMAVLKQLEEDLLHAYQRGLLLQWLSEVPVNGLSWGPVLGYMDKLCAEHRASVLPQLLAAVRAS